MARLAPSAWAFIPRAGQALVPRFFNWPDLFHETGEFSDRNRLELDDRLRNYTSPYAQLVWFINRSLVNQPLSDQGLDSISKSCERVERGEPGDGAERLEETSLLVREAFKLACQGHLYEAHLSLAAAVVNHLAAPVLAFAERR